ncbi:hypothetical protein MN116_000382 [Schistosoma mekongi]|uniref:Uncharacterized protein n=1 Tax=Schistosoma mekongi TaxID=38744 RepID=A0AAE2D8S3_SCHME|nr:hypothetical protein MN116_000382 [Schistosoma mekongi]
MSSYQGNERDRYETFRVRQGMRSGNNRDDYADFNSSPTNEGSGREIWVQSNRERTENQRRDNSEGYHLQNTYAGDNMSGCCYQRDISENLGPLVTYRVDDASQQGNAQDGCYMTHLPTYANQSSGNLRQPDNSRRY